MTQTFGTNSNNDLYIGSDGNLVVDSGQQAVEDACATATKMQLGEAIYQTTLGMPTFQSVWNGVPNLAVYENYLRRTIQAVEGVVRVVSIDVAVANNTLAYRATIESQYGITFTMRG